MFIAASKLYDYLQCPDRVWRDAHGPQSEKIQETNLFVPIDIKSGAELVAE